MPNLAPNANFAEILNRPAKDIKAPPVLPQGAYMGVIQGPYKPIVSAEKKTPGVEFTIALQQPISDVDQNMLLEAGGLAGKTVQQRFYITDGSVYYVKQFLVDHLGIEEGDKSMAELLAEAPGKTLGVNVVNQPSKSGDRMVHFIGSTFKV